jgi:hypothetical protein
VFAAILNAAPFAADSSKLAIVIEEMIAELLAGTVYKVVSTFADGLN